MLLTTLENQNVRISVEILPSLLDFIHPLLVAYSDAEIKLNDIIGDIKCNKYSSGDDITSAIKNSTIPNAHAINTFYNYLADKAKDLVVDEEKKKSSLSSKDGHSFLDKLKRIHLEKKARIDACIDLLPLLEDLLTTELNLVVYYKAMIMDERDKWVIYALEEMSNKYLPLLSKYFFWTLDDYFEKEPQKMLTYSNVFIQFIYHGMTDNLPAERSAITGKKPFTKDPDDNSASDEDFVDDRHFFEKNTRHVVKNPLFLPWPATIDWMRHQGKGSPMRQSKAGLSHWMSAIFLRGVNHSSIVANAVHYLPDRSAQSSPARCGIHASAIW